MDQIVLVTGASSGFGRMIANELAGAGHTVYGSMRGLSGNNAHLVSEVAATRRSTALTCAPSNWTCSRSSRRVPR